MRQALIDTDILSEIMEAKNPLLVAKARQYYRIFRAYTVSSVTYAEIFAGLTSEPKSKVQNSFTRIEPMLDVLSIERDEAATAGRIIGLLKAKGRTIGHLDPFIAATAIEQGLVLATGNTNHYQRIIDLSFPLQLENWRQG